LPTLSDIHDRELPKSRQYQPDADGHLFLVTPAELHKLAHDVGLSVVEHHLFAAPWVTGRLCSRHVADSCL